MRSMGKLEDGARELGLYLTAEHLMLFQRYYEELVEWSRRFNLTTVVGYEQVQLRHFLDSLTCLLAMPGWTGSVLGNQLPFVCRPQPLLLLDVGAGAGFPGLPLKIVCPELKLTLLEATRKKVEFLVHVVGHLGLDGVEVIWDRAETLGQNAHYRERYDVVVARAVAEMVVLSEYCLPFVRLGGRLIAQKGPEAPAEVEAAAGAIRLLGGEVRELKEVNVTGQRETRILVVVDKVAPTPATYPRRPGIPAKRPLAAVTS